MRRLLLLSLLLLPALAHAQYQRVQDEGSALAKRGTLNCVGAGITCSEDAVNLVTKITVPAGAGGPALPTCATGQAATSTDGGNWSCVSPVAIGYGGTGTGSTPNQGGVIFATSTASYACTAAGTSGQALASAGTGTPTWATYDGTTADTLQFRWDRESSTTPGLGTWTTITESGITGASLTQSSTNGNHLEATQTDGDTSWAHFNGWRVTSSVANDQVARVLFRPPGASGTAFRYGVHFRSTLTSGYLDGYLCWVGGTGSTATVYLDRRAAGAITNLRTSAALITTILPAYAVAQDPLTIAVSAIGSYVSCSVNGVLYARVYDTTYATGAVGVGTVPHNGAGTDTKASADTVEVWSVSTGTSFFRAH